jgi:hypothetical protein
MLPEDGRLLQRQNLTITYNQQHIQRNVVFNLSFVHPHLSMYISSLPSTSPPYPLFCPYHSDKKNIHPNKQGNPGPSTQRRILTGLKSKLTAVADMINPEKTKETIMWAKMRIRRHVMRRKDGPEGRAIIVVELEVLVRESLLRLRMTF